MADEGRCVSCGFLAKYARSSDPLLDHTYLEATAFERERGDFFRPTAYSVYLVPQCFKQLIPLDDLVIERARTAKLDRQLVAREIINEDRQCPQWYPYAPGFTPKVHAEQLAMQQLEQRRREFEKELSEMNRQIQADSLLAAQQNLAAGRKNVAATWIIGGIVIVLSLMQLLAIWYFSTRTTQHVEQPPTLQQPAESKPNEEPSPK